MPDVPVVCLGTVMVVDVLVNRSDKLQQFTPAVGENCAENRCVFKAAVLGAWLWTFLCSCREQVVTGSTVDTWIASVAFRRFHTFSM